MTLRRPHRARRALFAALASLALGALAVAGVPAAAPAAEPVKPAAAPRPDLLLVVVDTLRADAVGWVSGLDTTPAMDRLAAEGVRFPAAVSPVPLTLPAHASLMTGELPRRHGVHDNGQVLAPEATTLAEALTAAGYDTAAFVSGYPLRAVFGLDQGFALYDDRIPVAGGVWGKRPAADTAAAARAWLEARPAKGARPWFAFVHFYDAHDPYDPPAKFRRPGARGAYLGEVAAVDAELPALFAAARAAAPGGLLTVLAADHGESLGEHGEATHGFFLYESTVRVPLVVHFPGRLAPRESSQPARLIDVAPTALDLLGLPPLPAADGASLTAVLAGRGEVPPAYLESMSPWFGYGWSPLKAIRTASEKLIVAPRPELYDLRSDPGEATNLYASKRRQARRLRDRLAAIEARARAAANASPAGEEAAAALRALGYLGGGTGLEAPAQGLADPKDRLEEKGEIEGAEAAHAAGRLAEALRRFDALLAREPDNRFALLRRGQTLTALRRPGEAVAPLTRLVTIDPQHAEARFALADALVAARRPAEALVHWRALVAIEPQRSAAWSNLGATAAAAGREEEAIAALERAVALDPDRQLYRTNLAALYLRAAHRRAAAGAAEEAREGVAKALALAPALRAQAAADPKLRDLLP
jgi:choline-sulfatase